MTFSCKPTYIPSSHIIIKDNAWPIEAKYYWQYSLIRSDICIIYLYCPKVFIENTHDAKRQTMNETSIKNLRWQSHIQIWYHEFYISIYLYILIVQCQCLFRTILIGKTRLVLLKKRITKLSKAGWNVDPFKLIDDTKGNFSEWKIIWYEAIVSKYFLILSFTLNGSQVNRENINIDYSTFNQ